MIHRVEIRLKKSFQDAHAQGVLAQIKELGLHTVKKVRSARLFFLIGPLTEPQVCRAADELLADPVTEQVTLERGRDARDTSNDRGRDARDTEAVIEVHLKSGVMDPVAGSTEKAIRDMGLPIEAVRTARRYELIGPVDDAQRETIARRLLANDCIEEVFFAAHTPPETHGQPYALKVVTVPIRDLDAADLERLSKDRDLFLNLAEMQAIQQYFRTLGREPRDVEIETIAQTWSEHCGHKTFRSDVSYEGTPIPGWPSGSWAIQSSEDFSCQEKDVRQAILNSGYDGDHLDAHMAAMKESIATHTGPAQVSVRSEKSGDVRVFIDEKEQFGFVRVSLESDQPRCKLTIPNLIKNTIFRATQELNKPWCISVFKDNAGVIEFDDTHAVCFKVETHNHPSALDPYGGAGTGIGGVIRDPMGTGMGAFPVANTDVFCFGRPDLPMEQVPKGVLHPRRVMRGVVAGVRDYGNRMGIPTVNGAVYFDDRYLGNPLVFCGTAGILPREKCFKHTQAGDAVIVVGGRTGRDGIHGATFSSGELTHEHETEFSGAVQIGNAITEKKTLDTLMQARDLGLYNAITDCGAGGLSSAVGEMGEELGAEVHLDRVPLKYAGLSYYEIWISEAQERMALAVPPEKVDAILRLFAAEDVEATVIGTFGTPGAALRLFYQGTLVGELGMQFLHNGIPKPTKSAVWEKPDRPSPRVRAKADYSATLLKILSSPNVASKEWIIRQYDHEVQGGSAVKPLVGVGGDNPGDASVLRPVLNSRKGLVLSCGMNPRLGDLDPYQSALHAIDEALRNCVCVGGNLERTAILDNFCWGNCNKPDRMGALVQSAKACYDGAMAYGTPFISGKDSLNNEFVTDDGRTIAIPPTLLISAISVIDDVGRCVTADAKAAGNLLYVVGATCDRMGGSHFLLVEGKESGTDVPVVDPVASRLNMQAVQQAISQGLVRSCHDLSEGGLAVAAVEMAFGGQLGARIDLDKLPVSAAKATDAARLFAEDAGRFLIEVEPGKAPAFEQALAGVPHAHVGALDDTTRLVVVSATGVRIDVPVAKAKAAWQKTFGR